MVFIIQPSFFLPALRQGNNQGSKEVETPETVPSVVLPHPVILQRDTASPAGSSPTTRAVTPAATGSRNHFSISLTVLADSPLK